MKTSQSANKAIATKTITSDDHRSRLPSHSRTDQFRRRLALSGVTAIVHRLHDAREQNADSDNGPSAQKLHAIDEHGKPAIVAHSDAVANPRAVVIEALHAHVAATTVRSARRPENVARAAEAEADLAPAYHHVLQVVFGALPAVGQWHGIVRYHAWIHQCCYQERCFLFLFLFCFVLFVC